MLSSRRTNVSQVLKATGALVKHLGSESSKKQHSSSTRNLLANGDTRDSPSTDPQPIWLQLTTKTHIVDRKRLKPSKILLPHSLNRSATAAVLLIVPDPQRAYKDVLAHPTFPKPLAKQIRVLGVSKLKARYKSFESRRQLLGEYDVFLADDRVVPLLPKLLGKIVYETPKRPVPVSLEGYKPRDAAGKRVKGPDRPKSEPILPAEKVAKELEKALSSARVHLSPSVTTSVRIGFSDFTPQELADNLAAVVEGMQEKFITKGWRNIRSIHVKSPNSVALPIWSAPELWVDAQQVLEDEEVEKRKAIDSKKDKGKKRKRTDGRDHRAGPPKKKGSVLSSDGFNKEMAERREKLRAQKKEAMDQIEATANGSTVKAKEVEKVNAVVAAA